MNHSGHFYDTGYSLLGDFPCIRALCPFKCQTIHDIITGASSLYLYIVWNSGVHRCKREYMLVRETLLRIISVVLFDCANVYYVLQSVEPERVINPISSPRKPGVESSVHHLIWPYWEIIISGVFPTTHTPTHTRTLIQTTRKHALNYTHTKIKKVKHGETFKKCMGLLKVWRSNVSKL